MCSGSAMCGNSTTFKEKSGSQWVVRDLRLWAYSAPLAGGGSGRRRPLSGWGAPADDGARQHGTEEQHGDRDGERGSHRVDEGLGENVVGELLDSGSLSRRDAGRKRHAGLAASNLEHASGWPGKALHG